MAREAIVVELTNGSGFPRRYTVSNSTAISKGTLLKLTDPRTAVAYDGATVEGALPVAGIAAMDKEANDGSTSITAWTDGIFELTASGAIHLGAAVVFLNNNYVRQASGGITVAASGAVIAGYAMETASDAELVNVRIKI